MIRVFIADAHAVLRHGLKLMLEATRQFEVIESPREVQYPAACLSSENYGDC